MISVLSGPKFARSDSRPGRADFRFERAYFGPERADSRPERVDFRPERADFRPETAWGGLTNERTNEWTNKSPPVFGAAAQKRYMVIGQQYPMPLSECMWGLGDERGR